jgi:hypothetical protein
MKGCTFHPSTNNPTNQTNQRPFEEFLNFQKNHLKKVNESVKTLKEEKENKKLQAYRSPAINKVIIEVILELKQNFRGKIEIRRPCVYAIIQETIRTQEKT